jgi:hypothetical protein
MKAKKIVVQRNGKLTKREIIRRMWLRSVVGANPAEGYSLAYVARRIGEDISSTKSFLRWMVRHAMANATVDRRLVMFW